MRPRAELALLFERVVREADPARLRLDPARLFAAGPRLRVPPRRQSSEQLLRAAERELARLHLRELAALLRCAARRRAALERGAGVHPCHPRPAGALGSWRRACREALALARADGVVVAPRAGAHLERCLAHPVRDWPSAASLARSSLRLADCEHGRLQWARALIAGGRARRGLAQLERELARPVSRGLLWWALEGRAWAREDLGQAEAALTDYEAAARAPHAAPEVCASALALALARGERRRARAAAELLRDRLRGDETARRRARVALRRRRRARAG